MPFPDALKGNPKAIFFTDFDGTITLKDSNDWLTDNLGFGWELRKKGNLDVLEGKVHFRDAFKDMMDSIKTPFPGCIQALCDNIKLDPYFKDFYTWSREAGVPVIVLSGGMEPIVRALLVHLLGPDAEDIELVCNNVTDRPPKKMDQEGGWEIKFHDDSGFGHDKSLAIRPYAEAIAKLDRADQPTLLYAGDGVSDLSAAKETDLLFAKAGHDLIIYCQREQIPFTVFEDWQSITQTTKDIVDGKKSVKAIAAEGLEEVKQDSPISGRL